MNNITNIPIEQYAWYAGALVLVLSLFLVMVWGFKRYVTTLPVGKVRAGRRLSLVESAMIDGKRRLLLVRRDDTEHLLLLGIERDLVIESGIVAPEPSTSRRPLSPPEPPARREGLVVDPERDRV